VLVDVQGADLPSQQANLLECVEGSSTRPLEENGSASFSLKVFTISEPILSSQDSQHIGGKQL